MIYLSEVLLQNPQLNSFDDLCAVVSETAQRTHAFHLKIDIKPNYGDTPADWEDKIEAAFSGVSSVFGATRVKTEMDD